MSRTDTRFMYLSGTGNTSSSAFKTVAVGSRPTLNSTSGEKKVKVCRRSSSVTATRRRRPASRDQTEATLLWSDGWLSVHELTRIYARQFPVLARVMTGYDVNGLKLDTEQVLHIRGVCGVQKRVAASDVDGQTVSLPLDCPMRLRLTNSTSGQNTEDEMRLSEAVDTNELPLSVDCLSLDSGQPPQLNVFPGQRLTIDRVYDCSFLLANQISKGWLDVSRPLIIPADLPAMLSVAGGLTGATEDEWRDYCGMFARASRPVRVTESDFAGYKGFYYTKQGHPSSTTTPASVPVASRFDHTSQLDVQPYIISRRDSSTDDVPRRQSITRSLDAGPCSPLSATTSTKSLDGLNAVGTDTREMSLRNEVDSRTRRSARDQLPLSLVPRSRRSGRRQLSVAETSFTEVPGSTSHTQEIGVQVDMKRPLASAQPRMGRRSRAAAVAHRKSNSDDLGCEDHRDSELGGSMPCLPGAARIAPHTKDEQVSSRGVSAQASSTSSTSSGSDPTAVVLQREDEGYMTRDSNTSRSSVDTARHSPVYF